MRPGSIDIRPRRKNAGRPEWKIADAFRKWVRGRSCACYGTNAACFGDIQSAHVPFPGEKGVGTKVADRRCIPLSVGCHDLQHNIGWPLFAQRHLGGRDPAELAGDYWRRWPGRAAWERDQCA